ncbi:MAG: hypothetical protein ACLUJG_08485 [Lawsonibacter sp.]
MCGDRIVIRGAAVTGYGEDLIKNAFSCDLGLVETVAHYKAAAHFEPCTWISSSTSAVRI